MEVRAWGPKVLGPLKVFQRVSLMVKKHDKPYSSVACFWIRNYFQCWDWAWVYSVMRCFCPLYCHCDLFCPEQTNDKAAASLWVMIKPFSSSPGLWFESAHYEVWCQSFVLHKVLIMPSIYSQRVVLHSLGSELFLFLFLFFFAFVIYQCSGSDPLWS